MKKDRYIAPSIIKQQIIIGNSASQIVPSEAFETKVLGQLQETINLIVNRNNGRPSGDYQTTFRLSKSRLKQMLNSGTFIPAKHK